MYGTPLALYLSFVTTVTSLDLCGSSFSSFSLGSLETKAIDLPSGDHVMPDLPSSPWVSCLASPPRSRSKIHI